MTCTRGAMILSILALSPAALLTQEPSREGIEFFESRIRPVLVNNCFKCHSGPKVKAKLNLSNRAALLKGGESGPAIVPNDPDNSLLVKAIKYDDAELRMPPRGKLDEKHVADFAAWIRMGAPWPREQPVETQVRKDFDLRERARHWSLQPLKAPAKPLAKDGAWIKSPIDVFVLQKLQENKLLPTDAADRRTLLRRVTFDLIGLPPTSDEIDAFLGDGRVDAFDRVVDRLLASPHYGERWGRHWLDLVRYAETYGHEFDPDIADAYKYRDYVIRALNNDVPFNQFVTEHIAGDLLENPRRHPGERTNESILATAFWWLGEAKHSPVDVRGDQADRIDNQIDVFGKAFLGMTIACARCHDHKFDAISTKDYYGLAGFLQSFRLDRALVDDPEPRRKTLMRLEKLHTEVRHHGQAAAAVDLEKKLDDLAVICQTTLGGLKEAARLSQQARGSAIVFADSRTGGFRQWLASGEAFQSQAAAALAPLHPDKSEAGSAIAIGGSIHSGRISTKLVGSIRSPTFTIEKKRIHYRAAGSQTTVRLVLDGLQLIQDPIYGRLTFNIDGKDLRWHTQDVSMWIGHRAYVEILDNGPGHGVVDQVVFSDAAAPPDEPNPLLGKLLDEAKASTVAEQSATCRALLADVVARFKAGSLSDNGESWARVELLNWMISTAKVNPCPVDLPSQKAALEEIRKLESSLPPPRRALACAEGSPVDEKVFLRGNHKNLGEIVPRRFLEVFGGARETDPKGSRLELAKHMVDPERTPILPRVLVNRLWKHHFGEGIVRTPDDFGVLGQAPTHPELLDFLASEFIKNGWSIKRMHRMLLLSATYQMSSRAKPQADQADPDNKWLHKMPVRRLEAEAIRDSMLAVSGRLDRAQYGPSVPPHLSAFMLGRGRPGASGPLDGNGRRSIYLMVRRNFINPMFVAFDYPTPFSTIGRRGVSNVPAQALTMMNNPFVVQQAETWGKKVAGETGLTPAQRLEKMYVAALTRPPSEGELAQALPYLEEQARIYGGPNDVRVWSEMAHVLFNVKGFIFLD